MSEEGLEIKLIKDREHGLSDNDNGSISHGNISSDEEDMVNQDEVIKEVKTKLIIASFICLFVIAAEATGGIMAKSLAIISDAAHMLSDLLGFVISLLSIWLASKKSNKEFSYGYHRAEILGAMSSVLIIWGLTIWLV